MPAVLKSRTFRKVVVILASAIFIMCVFQLGVSLGYRKATFSYRWGDNYHQNFAGPQRGFFNDFAGHGFIDAHGTTGAVIKVDGNAILIRDKNDTEQTIMVGNGTVIRRMDRTVQPSDIFQTERAVIIGSPNESGQIEATFIRLFPPDRSL